MATAIKRWGNSLAVRLPSALTDLANFREDQNVTIKLESGRLVIEKAYDLEALCRKITPSNKHSAVTWGPAVGNEFGALEPEDYSQL